VNGIPDASDDEVFPPSLDVPRLQRNVIAHIPDGFIAHEISTHLLVFELFNRRDTIEVNRFRQTRTNPQARTPWETEKKRLAC
jgi:hypothetical protein